MKNRKSINANSIHRLLFMSPVICSMAFAACSDIAGTAGTHPNINLLSAVEGKRDTAKNVTIGPRTYNTETRSFDRPWPFGPESDQQ
jgi:hypothetical protein